MTTLFPCLIAATKTHATQACSLNFFPLFFPDIFKKLKCLLFFKIRIESSNSYQFSDFPSAGDWGAHDGTIRREPGAAEFRRARSEPTPPPGVAFENFHVF